jgi:hypothetical protein
VTTTIPTQKRKQPAEFIFRGNAVAAAGFLVKSKGQPVHLNPKTPTVHGESSLPMAGGVSHSSVREPALSTPQFIKYSDCETFAMGGPQGGDMVTTVSASVKNVRIATSPSPEDNCPGVTSTVFEAASLSIMIRSTHPPSGDPRFEVVGQPVASGLFLATTDHSGAVTRKPIQLVFDSQVCAPGTLDELDQQFLGNEQFFKEHRTCFDTEQEMTFGSSKLPRNSDGYVMVPIVKEIVLGQETIPGNVLLVPGFGRISFGVMLTDQISRRIALVRVKFGSDPGGDSCLTSVETNGIWQ